MKFKLQLLANFLPIKKWSHEAKQHADSLGLARHVPHRDTIPADLRDREGNFLVTENGFSVAGRMLAEEVDIGTASPFLPLYIGLYALVFVVSKLMTTIGLDVIATVLHLVYFAGFFTLFGALANIAKTANEAAKTVHKRGIVVLDGKAVLAQDCAKFLDVVVEVGKVKNFNFFEGLTPEVLATTLENQFAPKKQQSGNSAFFTNGARTIVFYTKVFQEAMIECGTAKKSVMEFYKVASQLMEPCVESKDLPVDQKPAVQTTEPAKKSGSHPLVTAIEDHPDFLKEGTLLNDAVNYLLMLQQEPAETKQNIFATFRSWISPFVQSEDLRTWADSETSDFDFNQVMYGLKIGFVLPASKFGVAGTAITALMKARLFTMISSRGDRWHEAGQSQVFLFMDESQRVIDKADQDILPVARSLGLSCVYATQNIERCSG